MAVHTCTRCPLRFTTRAEVVDHLAHDHHLPPQALEPLSYPGAREAAPLYAALAGDDDVHTVLVVANQTLGSPTLLQALHQRQVAHGTVAAYVVVPATPSTHLATAPGSGRPAPAGEGLGARTDDAGLAAARFRLRHFLAALRDMGMPAHGRVGDPNPLTAAGRALAEQPIDEVLISTLDPDTSRWLRLDLPAALARRAGVPVATVSGRAAVAAPDGGG